MDEIGKKIERQQAVSAAYINAWSNVAGLSQLLSLALQNLQILNQPDQNDAAAVALARAGLEAFSALLGPVSRGTGDYLDQFLRLTDPSVSE